MGEHLTDDNAYTFLLAVTEIIRILSSEFAVAPILYSNASYVSKFYWTARNGYEKKHGAGSWNDRLFASIVPCPKWVFGPVEYQKEQRLDPKTGKSKAVSVNVTDPDFSSVGMRAPAGYQGAWDASWSFWQWGIVAGRVRDSEDSHPTTAHSLGLPSAVDVDMWNGDLDEFAAFASRPRWK